MRAAEYPFGRAAGSFVLGDGERLVAAALDGAPGPAPLLAYGANGAPERLAAKLGPGASAAALVGVLHGWAVVHSAHVSPYGAVPATLVRTPARRAGVHVLLLDDAASAAVDATEPNYARVRLDGLDLEAERLGRVDAAHAYLSRWGPLRAGGRVVDLGALPQDGLRALVTGAAGPRV